MATPRILFFNRSCYFDSTNGAAIASRNLMRCLVSQGFAIEVVSGTLIDAGPEVSLSVFLERLGVPYEVITAHDPGSVLGLDRPSHFS